MIFRRNRNKKYNFENNTTDAQKIISRKMDEMELNKNHSGQVWFYKLVLFRGISGNFYGAHFLELKFETEKSSPSRILQFFAFALLQITVILLEHRSQVT